MPLPVIASRSTMKRAGAALMWLQSAFQLARAGTRPNCAPLLDLQERMAQRRHSKLYYSKRGFTAMSRATNRNPMRVRALWRSRPPPFPPP